MIAVNTVVSRLNAALDAEGSGRYQFDRDFVPAINYSIEFWVSVFNSAFGDNKLSEENLRELIRTRIWQTSKYSRVHFNIADIVDEIWSLLAVMPNPVMDPVIPQVANPDNKSSIFVPDSIFVSAEDSAARQTHEEWSAATKNVFMPGNTALEGTDFQDYAYKNFTHLKPGEAVSDIFEEIEIRPYLDEKFVAVTYLVFPKSISLISDTILYPQSMQNLIVDKALFFISEKQGDGTNLYAIQQKEIADLVGLMS